MILSSLTMCLIAAIICYLQKLYLALCQRLSSIFDEYALLNKVKGIKLEVEPSRGKNDRGLPILYFYSSAFPTYRAACLAEAGAPAMVPINHGVEMMTASLPAASPNLVDELKQLNDLKSSGALSDAEFTQAKAACLAKHTRE